MCNSNISFTFVVCLIAFSLSGSGSADQYIGKISPYALSPYTKHGYPDTLKKYGSRLKEIEFFRRKAAELAIESNKCDVVEIVELSMSRSSLNHLHFWVDCRNLQRIYLDEFQLSKGGDVLTEKEKSWDKNTSIALCRKGILNKLNLRTVNIHETTRRKAPRTYNVAVTIAFNAEKVTGLKTKFLARCHFTPGNPGTIEIIPRY